MSMKDVYPYPLFEQARKNCPNPFNLQKIISASEVWGKVITNLPSLNSHIDEEIFKAVFEVRHNYSNQIGIAIKGDRGTGKSHVIHRVWKKISQEGEAVFAYISPCSNPKRINSHVLFYLADSFNHQDVQGVTQWQKLAASTILILKGTKFEKKYRTYIDKCSSPNDLKQYIRTNIPKEERKVFFDDLVEDISEKETDVDYKFLKALLLLLNPPKDARISLDWIQGIENSEFERVGLPEIIPEEKEDKSIWMIEQICQLAKKSSLPVLICFDQIDNFGTDNDSGNSPPEIVASCIDRIYLQCRNIIIICCLLSDAWRDIEQMGSGIPDRVSERSLTAKPPTSQEMIELVKQRLNWFYHQNNLNKNDYPDLYPFNEIQIKKIASEGAGVRSLMQWCAENFEARDEVEKAPNKLLVEENKKEKEFLDIYKDLLKKIYIPIKDDDKLAAIICCCMKMIPEAGTENVEIKQVNKINHNSNDLQMIVYAYDSKQERDVKIGIRVCETTNGHTFHNVIKKLLEYENYGITRGCLVRSTPLRSTWKSGIKKKQKLENEKKGEVVVWKKDDIKPLVAIQEIYEQAENYGFSKEEVINLVKDLKLAADNPLIREILSAPA